MPFSVRHTNERRLASGLALISGASPIIVFVSMFALWSVFTGQRSWFVITCVALLLAWFAIACALETVERHRRGTRLSVWGLSLAFHLGLALLVWRLVGGFGIFLAAIELFVAGFSVGGFLVAYLSTEPHETA